MTQLSAAAREGAQTRITAARTNRPPWIAGDNVPPRHSNTKSTKIGRNVWSLRLTMLRRRCHRRRRTPQGCGEGGSMAQVTINEGLAWLKTLKKRHEELLALRNDNAHRERRFYGASADKEIVKEPVYDVKVLDKLVTRVAREIRLLEQALKATNAKTAIDTYNQDDAVLGELS
jgi:hypothetical protein